MYSILVVYMMKLHKYIIQIIVLAFFFQFCSCNGNDKYSDFDTDASGLKYKFLEKSESSELIKQGDYVEMELKYANESDSLLFNSKELRASFKMQINGVSHLGGSFENAVFLSHPGDRILFVLPAGIFIFVGPRGCFSEFKPPSYEKLLYIDQVADPPHKNCNPKGSS